MSYQLDEADTQGFWLWWRLSVRTLAIALTCGVAGATLVALAWRFGDKGPAILVAVALIPFVLLLTINDPRVAMIIVFTSFLFGFTSITIFLFDIRLNIQAVDIAILLATLLVVMQRLAVRQVPISWAAPLWWSLLLVLWAIVSMTSALDQSEAFKQVGSLATGLILATIVFTLCRQIQDIDFICTALVIAAVAVGLPALSQTGELQSYYGGSIVEGRVTGIFGEPNELGLFSAMTAMIAAGLLLASRSSARRFGYSAILAILVLSLTLSLSRGAWMGAGVGILVLLVTLPVARRMLLVAGIPLLIVGFVVSSLAPSSPNVRIVGERLLSFGNIDQPYDDRPAIYTEAIRQIRDDPMTGQGPGNFSVAAQRLTSGGIIVTASHAHSAYLNIAAELGLPALLSLVAFILVLALRGRRAIRAAHAEGRSSDAALVAGIAAALAANVTTGFVNNFLGNPIIEPTIWVSVGMLLAAYRILCQPEKVAESLA